MTQASSGCSKASSTGCIAVGRFLLDRATIYKLTTLSKVFQQELLVSVKRDECGAG